MQYSENQVFKELYIDNIVSLQAYAELANNESAKMLDVRTETEWKETGIADLSKINRNLIKISWRLMDMQINHNFLMQISQVLKSEDKIYVICRSGVRSYEAANFLNNNGYHAVNIIDGFAGSKYGNGWLKSNLPVEDFYV